MIKENENRTIIQKPIVVDREYIRWMGYKEVKCQEIEKVLIPGIKINLSCLSLFNNLIIKDEEQDIKSIEKSNIEINKSRKSSTVSNASNKNNSNVSNTKAINTNKRNSNTSNKSENKDNKNYKEEENKDSYDDKAKDVRLVNETNVISTYLEAGLRFFDLKYKIVHTHFKDTSFYKSNKAKENKYPNTQIDDFDKSLVLILNQIKEFINKNSSELVILDISDLIKYIGLAKKKEFDEKIQTRNSNTGNLNVNVNVNNLMNNPINNNTKTSSNMIIQKIGNKISNLFGSNKEINKLNKDNNSNININTNIKSNFNNNYINNNKNINTPNNITSNIGNNSNNSNNNNNNNNIMNSNSHNTPYENSKDINLLIEKIKSILKSSLLLIIDKFIPLSIVQLEKLKGKVIIFLDKNNIHEIKTASPKYERMKLIEKERESLISSSKTNDANNAINYTKYALTEHKILNKDSLIFKIIKFGHFFLIHEVKTQTDFDNLIIDFKSHFSNYYPNIIFIRDFNQELIRSMIDWNFINKSDIDSKSKKRTTVKSCDSNLEFFNASKNKSKLSNLSSIINIRDNKKSVDFNNHNIYNNYSNLDEINKERKRSRHEEMINKNKDFDDFDFDKKLNEHNDLYFDDNGELRNKYNNYDFIDQNMSTISDNDFTMNNLYSKEHLNSNINKTNNKSQSDKTTNNFKLFNQLPNDAINNANNKSKSNKEHQSSLLRNNYIHDNYKKKNSLFNSNYNKNTSTNQVIIRNESDNNKNNKNNNKNEINENNISNKSNNERNKKPLNK